MASPWKTRGGSELKIPYGGPFELGVPTERMVFQTYSSVFRPFKQNIGSGGFFCLAVRRTILKGAAILKKSFVKSLWAGAGGGEALIAISNALFKGLHLLKW